MVRLGSFSSDRPPSDATDMSAIRLIATELVHRNELTRCAIRVVTRRNKRERLFDHLLGAGEQAWRDFQAERVPPAKSCRPLAFLFLVTDITHADYFAPSVLDSVITGHVQPAEDVH